MDVGRNLDTASLGAVLKTALDAVVVMRMAGTIAGWNDVAEQTFGWTFEEAKGQRMSEMVIPLRLRAAHEQGLAHYIATGEGPVLDRHIEIEALHRDGHEVPIELSITRTSQFGGARFPRIPSRHNRAARGRAPAEADDRRTQPSCEEPAGCRIGHRPPDRVRFGVARRLPPSLYRAA
jgi:PAS domain S-box-containing protein